VMCSICGTPLGLASEAPQAQRERAYIERLIADCRSKDQIKRALVAQFGEAVLALPGDAGDDNGIEDVLVYLIPAVGIVLAAGGIAFALTRWRRRRPGGSTQAAAAADSSRVDVDMERYDL
jgi:cytochrome c-type biogenesis protein CcmH